jgi:DNA invertase Pin-like site-specific DNA recombinase
MTYRKLSPALHDQVIEAKGTHKEIALELGIHKDTVGRLKRKSTWEQTYGITSTKNSKRSLARS